MGAPPRFGKALKSMAYLSLGFVNWGLYGPGHHQHERRHHFESGRYNTQNGASKKNSNCRIKTPLVTNGTFSGLRVKRFVNSLYGTLLGAF